MEIKIQTIEKIDTYRKYRIFFRKDRRCNFTYTSVSFRKFHPFNWVLEGLGGHAPREVVLKIESILRGLNSNVGN